MKYYVQSMSLYVAGMYVCTATFSIPCQDEYELQSDISDLGFETVAVNNTAFRRPTAVS